MSINCDIIVQRNATPEQLTALGTGLWRWCSRAATNTASYSRLDSQPLADLIAGKLPITGRTPARGDKRGLHLGVLDRVSHDRQATVDSLRQDLPLQGVEDIVIDGKSWNLFD